MNGEGYLQEQGSSNTNSEVAFSSTQHVGGDGQQSHEWISDQAQLLRCAELVRNGF